MASVASVASELLHASMAKSVWVLLTFIEACATGMYQVVQSIPFLLHTC